MAQAQSIFAERLRRIRATTHQIMIVVLMVQAVLGCAAAWWLTPIARREVSAAGGSNIVAASAMAVLAFLTIILIKRFPDEAWTRHLVGAVQILFSSLFVHLTAGHFETYFHIFASLALVAFYRDPRVLATVTALVAVDLLSPEFFLPLAFWSGGFERPTLDWFEHLGWINFQNAVLVLGFRFSKQELMRSCEQQAKLTVVNSELDIKMAQLRESEEDYRYATLAANEVHWKWDVRTLLCEVADRFYEYFELKKVPGENPFERWRDHIHPEDRERVLSGLFEFTKSDKTIWSDEFRFLRGDGSYAYCHSRGYLMRDPEGAPLRLVGAMQDLTLRKQREEEQEEINAKLRRSEERFHLAARATNDSVWDWDVVANDCWLAENLYTAYELIKNDNEPPLETWKNAIHPEDSQRVMQEIGDLFAGGGTFWSSAYRFRRGDGTYAFVFDRGYVLRDASGKPLRMIGAMQDVTLQKLSEVAQERARQAAEEANLAKSDFLANMSHEIRTPLNGIIGMTELALETPLSREQKEYLVAIDRSALALLNVVNDVLDFAKVEANKLDFDSAEVDLREVVEELTRLTSVTAHRKGLELNVRIDPQVPLYVLGDSGRIRQVLLNLIANAVKFTPMGEVNVFLECVKLSQASAHIRFAVQDSGIGIPKQKLEAVFEKFVQGDTSTRRNYGGTGLGLAISTTMVEKMGGHIRLMSEEGKGSTFSFDLEFPLPEGAASTRPPLQPVPKFAEISVLVVDDNATNRKILVDTLRSWGMKVSSAVDGLHALGMMREAKERGDGFELLLTDSKMPKMDGFELASVVKNDPAMAGTTILMLTSDNQRGDISRCKKVGIEVYLVKPVRQAELLQAINGVLGRSSSASAQEVMVVAPAAMETRRSLRVLVAEDNPINQMMAVRILEKEGHLVTVAENGGAAVRLVNSERFDLVLMDVQMPDMDGFEATAAIRASEKEHVANIPIVAMTAHAMKTYAKKCIDAGMDGYVSKPIRRAELARALLEFAHPVTAAVEAPAGRFHDFRERTGGDHALMMELVHRYLDTVPQLMAEIRSSVGKEQWEEVAFQSHTLKGAVGNFCADGAHQAALELEHAARNRESAHARAQWEQLVREVQALSDALMVEFKPSVIARAADRP